MGLISTNTGHTHTATQNSWVRGWNWRPKPNSKAESEGCTAQDVDILIRDLDVELLVGLAEGRTIQLGGHLNQVVTAEEEVSFASCF